MIYFSNFFARRIEAVSRQLESARGESGNPIITCKLYFNQGSLRWVDVKDNIWVFPCWLFPLVYILVMFFSSADIHYFEDEPSRVRKFLFNFRKRNLYISLFKEPDKNLLDYLGSLKYLRAISRKLY